MKRLNEKKTRKSPRYPQYRWHQRHYCFHPGKNTEWHGTIPENPRNVPQKCRSWTSIWFNFANIKYTSHTHYWLPKHKSDGNAHFSLEDSATELFLPHWRSDKNKQSNAQWHAQQWQQDSMTNYSKRQNWGEIWNQWGTIPVNSSFEHEYYHHQKPAPLAPTSTTTVHNFKDVRLKPATSDTRRLTISLHSSRYVISSGL